MIDHQIRNCTIDGGWSQWTPWTPCPAVCGIGSINRKRYCNNPSPMNGGYDCEGSHMEFKPCQADKLCTGKKFNSCSLEIE